MKSEYPESIQAVSEVKKIAEQALTDEKTKRLLEEMSMLAGLPTPQLLLAYIRFLPDVLKAHFEKKAKK